MKGLIGQFLCCNGSKFCNHLHFILFVDKGITFLYKIFLRLIIFIAVSKNSKQAEKALVKIIRMLLDFRKCDVKHSCC